MCIPQKGNAKNDFPPFKNRKFGNCFVQVYGSQILDIEKSLCPSGTTFGTPAGSVVRAPGYGDQSGMVVVKVPVNLPDGSQTRDYFSVMEIRQGRSTAQVSIDQVSTPPSASLTRSLAKTVTAKMRAKPPRR